MGLLPAFVLIIGSPPLLILLAIAIVIGPVSRPERLGLGVACALVLIVVGGLQATESESGAVWWLVGGIVLATLALTRYRFELLRGAETVRLPGLGVRHYAATAFVLSVVACVLTVTLSGATTSELGVPHDTAAILASAFAIAPLAAASCRARILITSVAASALLGAAVIVSFYFLPAAVVLVASFGQQLGRSNPDTWEMSRPA